MGFGIDLHVDGSDAGLQDAEDCGPISAGSTAGSHQGGQQPGWAAALNPKPFP